MNSRVLVRCNAVVCNFFVEFVTQILILTCFPFSQTAFGAGSFEIHLVSIQNIGGEKLDGDCCDGSRTIYRGQHQCLDECDTFFRVCLKQYSQTVSPTGACTFGEHTTAVLGGSSITFTNTTSPNGFRNPISIRFTFSWLVSHCISFLEVILEQRGYCRHSVRVVPLFLKIFRKFNVIIWIKFMRRFTQMGDIFQ